MFDQPFITEEHRMVAETYRKFVDKEIMGYRDALY